MVSLCGRKGRCCPQMNKSKGTYTITDDYGGKIVLTSDEVDNIAEAKKQLDSQ